MGEIRNAIRVLRATPIVSAVAVLSLALGFGATTAMFSILDSLLLRALPVRQPQRLVALGHVGDGRRSWTNPIWEAIRDRSQLAEGALAYSHERFNLSLGGQTEFVDGIWTSGRYFDVLGVPALLGRTWIPSDDQRGGGPDGPVAVLAYDFCQRRFGGDAGAIGRPLTIERVTYTIVGLRLVGAGIAAGAGASWWASSYVAPLLYDLQPRDPATFIGSAVVLATVGALAGWVPAMRASRLDPARVLRNG